MKNTTYLRKRGVEFDDYTELNALKSEMNALPKPIQTAIVNVYEMLQSREVHPRGRFDGAKRWYADNEHLLTCRKPSRSWPYSQMTAARTKKYVFRVAVAYNCKTEADLLNRI